MPTPISLLLRQQHQPLPPFLLCLFLFSLLWFYFFFGWIPETTSLKEQVGNRGEGDYNNNNNQRIVILPGPHKTGSTSIQIALHKWLAVPALNTSNSAPKHGIPPFEEWAFPIPSREDITDAADKSNMTSKVYTKVKAFSMLASQLRVTPAGSDMSQDPIYRLFQKQFQAAWTQGYNLVIATEEFDQFSSEAVNSTPAYKELAWQRLLSCLPSPLRSENIVLGVHHRTPRIDHLISVWHQVGDAKESLLNFVTKPGQRSLRTSSPMLNSMGVADFFVQKGYSVVILDSEGMKSASVDLVMATACHVLRVPCKEVEGKGLEFVVRTDDKTVSTDSGEDESVWVSEAEKRNVRVDQGRRVIKPRHLNQMNRLLREYDCQFQYLADRQSDKVQMLYANNTFLGCPPSISRRTFLETIQAIITLICQHYPDAQNCLAGKS